MIKHRDDEAEIDQRNHTDDPPEALCWSKEIHALWAEVGEGAQKQAARIDGLPPIFFMNSLPLLISEQVEVLQVVILKRSRPDVVKCQHIHQLNVIWYVWNERQ